MKKGHHGEIILFEIPVYSMTEQAFLDKWKRKHDRAAARQPDSAPVDKDKLYARQKQMVWQYNQIVGYVTVRVWEDEISCNVYMRTRSEFVQEERNPHYDSGRKAYMEDLRRLGFAFEIGDYQGEELKSEIKAQVEAIIREHVKKPQYADTELFEATLDAVDIMKLIETRKQQGRGLR